MMALVVDLTPCKPSMSSAESLALNMSGTWTNDILSKPLITQKLTAWRRGELEYSGVLKTRRLLIFLDAKNAGHGEIAPNWNVSGTRRKSNFKKKSLRRCERNSRRRLKVELSDVPLGLFTRASGRACHPERKWTEAPSRRQ